jgi:hypothetical protein
MTNDDTPALLDAIGNTTPVPSDVAPAYALGWLGAAIQQVADNDRAITDYEIVMEDGERAIVGLRVHGVSISLMYNVTP